MAPVPHPEELLVRSVSGADRCAGLRSEHHRRLRRLAADAEPLQVSWQMGGDGGHGGGLFKGIFTMKHRDLADLNHEEWIRVYLNMGDVRQFWQLTISQQSWGTLVLDPLVV